MNRLPHPSYTPCLAKSSGSTVVCRVLIISELRATGSGISGKMTAIDGDQQRIGVERIMLTHYGWQKQAEDLFSTLFPGKKRGAYRHNGV
jgi:hypothetical protein